MFQKSLHQRQEFSDYFFIYVEKCIAKIFLNKITLDIDFMLSNDLGKGYIKQIIRITLSYSTYEAPI